MGKAEAICASKTEDMTGIISAIPRSTNTWKTYEQVVTTALSFNCTLHLSELHRKWKSMMCEVCVRMEVLDGS
jgi:hypothetical protein